MAASLTTTREDLADSRVRVEVEVEPSAVEQELEGAARALAGDMKVPGFRQGKVPTPVVIQRIGRQAVLDEAVRRALPGWYGKAVQQEHIAVVGEPDVNLADLPERGAPLSFAFEVGVRPSARLGDYRGLDVARREPAVPEEAVDAEVDRLREAQASLETVERPAARGDFLVIDFVGTIEGEEFEGGQARGHLLELGSGQLLEGFEEGLLGAIAGEDREVRVSFPEDYRVEGLAGREAVFAVTVREVKEKRLPDADDEFALEAGGYDTLAELRADIRARLAEREEHAIDREFREAVVDAAVERAEIDLPSELVHAKAHELWQRTARRLESQGIDPARYIELTGKDQEALIHESEPEAEQALRRESVLAAIVEAEGIEVSDEEILQSLREAATGPGEKPPSERKLVRSLERAKADGRADMLSEDIAMRKAVDLLVESAKPVSPERIDARERLWTPGDEPKDGPSELWTPGS
ncbi:MAG: trigger factor [Actinomycetota bacterium]|nr:trigger factor [Actinomycetota bacterium]